MLKKRAVEICGGLGKPSKMPGKAWGTQAVASCRIGAILARVTDSSCAICYAYPRPFRNNYARSNVKRAQQRRLDALRLAMAMPEYGSVWVKAIATLIGDDDRFRWLDSGDLQSVKHLKLISTVATLTPATSHWLPTREYSIVSDYLKAYPKPSNLCIRLSAPMIDSSPPKRLGLPTSTIHDTKPAQGFPCRAYQNSPVNCGDCAACWDSSVVNVSYPRHSR